MMRFLNLRRTVKALLFSFTLLFFGASTAFGQVPMQQQQQEPAAQNFSDEEIEQFVNVYQQASEIQQENEAKMMQAIEEEEIEMERFNEILVAQQNQQNAEEINATAEEMASFNNAAEKIMQVQQEAQTEITQLIEQELGADKYQAIVAAYQQDPEIQQKVNEKLMESQQGTE